MFLSRDLSENATQGTNKKTDEPTRIRGARLLAEERHSAAERVLVFDDLPKFLVINTGMIEDVEEIVSGEP